MSAELPGELEGLDQAIQHLVAPVKDRFAQLHRTFRDAASVGALVVQRVAKFHPATFLQVIHLFPQWIHSYFPPFFHPSGHCLPVWFCDSLSLTMLQRLPNDLFLLGRTLGLLGVL